MDKLVLAMALVLTILLAAAQELPPPSDFPPPPPSPSLYKRMMCAMRCRGKCRRLRRFRRIYGLCVGACTYKCLSPGDGRHGSSSDVFYNRATLGCCPHSLYTNSSSGLGKEDCNDAVKTVDLHENSHYGNKKIH